MKSNQTDFDHGNTSKLRSIFAAIVDSDAIISPTPSLLDFDWLVSERR